MFGHNFEGAWSHWAMPFGFGWFLGLGAAVIFLLAVWSLYWKGRALWRAARSGEKIWFVVFLVVNTLGILEIVYLYVLNGKSKPVASK